MFCGKCGSQLPDNAFFCPVCGAPSAAKPQSPVQTQEAPAGYAQQDFRDPAMHQQQAFREPAQNTSRKKLFILIGSIAAAVVVILLLVIFLGGGGGSTATPEGTIKKLERAMNNLNIKEMLECFDSEAQQLYGGESLDFKSYADAFGLRYEIRLTPVHTEYYMESGREYADVTVDMYYTVTAFGERDSSSITEDLTLVKENGQWKIPSSFFYDLTGSLF